MSSRTIGAILTLRDNMSSRLFRVSRNVNNMSRDMQRASRQATNMANGFTAGVNKMVGKAAKLAKVGAGVAAGVAGTGAVALVKQSDTYAGIQARLALINDGQQTVAQFNDKIFKTANAAKSSYEDMATIIGKLGITAGSAFKSNDEILKFTELLSKNFKIAGASTEEQSAAMYQLTQAMGAGKLQGDEFRSIMENAPLLAQAIATEMNVPIGKLKEMSSEGVITSDIIKNALFNSEGEINQKFAQMPLTFGGALTKMKTQLTGKLQPTFEKMSTWLNSDAGTAVINKIADGISRLVDKIPAIANGIKTIYDTAKKVFDFIVKHQDVIIFFFTFSLAISAMTKAVLFAKAAFGLLQFAVVLFNGALSVSVIGLVVLGIAALIAVGVLLWKNWDTVKAKASELWSSITTRFGQIAADAKRDWDQIKQAGANAWQAIANTWENFKTTISEGFTTFITGIQEKWKSLKQFLAHPIKGVVKLFQQGGGGGEEDPVQARRGGKALGTSYWRGGRVRINERGGEIVDLPNGSRVIPADKSQKMLNSRGVSIGNIIIHAKGVTAAEVINEVVPQLKLVLANI